MAGRPRKPTKLLKLTGTARPDRHGKPETWFELPAEAPKPPSWLRQAARDRWMEIVKDAAYNKVLASLDGGALLAHCLAWQDCADKEKEGESPSAKMLSVLLSSCQRLGISPADRSRIKLPEQPKENKWSKFSAPTESSSTVKPS